VRNLLLCNIKLTSLADKVLQNFLATMTGRPNSISCGVKVCGGEKSAMTPSVADRSSDSVAPQTSGIAATAEWCF